MFGYIRYIRVYWGIVGTGEGGGTRMRVRIPMRTPPTENNSESNKSWYVILKVMYPNSQICVSISNNL